MLDESATRNSVETGNQENDNLVEPELMQSELDAQRKKCSIHRLLLRQSTEVSLAEDSLEPLLLA